MVSDVFISYSSQDKVIALSLCKYLEENNLKCWIAPRDILPGQNYGGAIIEGIEKTAIMILILSSHSNESSQVLREIERAVTKGHKIIPFIIENISLSKPMEYFIGSFHWMNAYTPPIRKHFKDLAEIIKKNLNIEDYLYSKYLTGSKTNSKVKYTVNNKSNPLFKKYWLLFTFSIFICLTILIFVIKSFVNQFQLTNSFTMSKTKGNDSLSGNETKENKSLVSNKHKKTDSLRLPSSIYVDKDKKSQIDYSNAKYNSVEQNINPSEISKSNNEKIIFSGSLNFKLMDNTPITIKLNREYFITDQDYKSGTEFCINLINYNSSAYIYILSSDQSKRVQKIFPPLSSFSLIYAKGKVEIPYNRFRLNSNYGLAYFCIIFSKKQINIDSLVSYLNSRKEKFVNNLKYVLHDRLVDFKSISFSQSNNNLEFYSELNKKETVLSITIAINNIPPS